MSKSKMIRIFSGMFWGLAAGVYIWTLLQNRSQLQTPYLVAVILGIIGYFVIAVSLFSSTLLIALFGSVICIIGEAILGFELYSAIFQRQYRYLGMLEMTSLLVPVLLVTFWILLILGFSLKKLTYLFGFLASGMILARILISLGQFISSPYMVFDYKGFLRWIFLLAGSLTLAISALIEQSERALAEEPKQDDLETLFPPLVPEEMQDEIPEENQEETQKEISEETQKEVSDAEEEILNS